MKCMRKIFVIILILIGCIGTASAETPQLNWEHWSSDIFTRAQKENKFVLLDLEAVWCHWCHVMKTTTYRDPKVIALLQAKYITVRVDQDSNPALSNRYEDYGWPATVVFGPQGNEIVKRRGYIPPEWMASMLQAIIDDPTPVQSITNEVREVVPAANAFITAEQRSKISGEYFENYDYKFGGWGVGHKFIDPDCLELALTHADSGDPRYAAMAQKTLEANLRLIDPVWGGVYQYSDSVDWKSPHYEKIMQYQSGDMRLYAQAYALWHKPAHLKAALDIHRYLEAFLLSPEGAFYTSQDADVDMQILGKRYYALKDSRRRKLGIPRVDTNIYARENGWVITALTALYNATGEVRYLEQAKRAANWIVKNQKTPAGGYRHGDAPMNAGEGHYLGDTLAMGQAALALYASTGDRYWLKEAQSAAGFINKNFRAGARGIQGAGYVTSLSHEKGAGVFKIPVKQIDENVGVARFTNLLSHYTGNKRFRVMAEHAMRHLASPQVIDKRFLLVGILMAQDELNSEPLHITVVGAKDDNNAAALYRAALALPGTYRRIEWLDLKEGKLPNQQLQFPKLERAAAFICTATSCSLPAFSAEELGKNVSRAARPAGQATQK